MSKTQVVLYTLTILYLSLYIPFTITAYSTSLNLLIVDEYEYIEDSVEKSSITNLLNFYLYKDKLDSTFWNEKEIEHLTEVRNIFLIVHLLALISIIGAFKYYKNSSKSYLFNIGVLIVFSILIFLNFAYFWDYIFHPLIFNNNLWITDLNDLSTYLFTYSFFEKIAMIIIGGSIIINIILYLRSKIITPHLL